MNDAGIESERGRGIGAKVARLFAWFFLFGFVLNAVQLLTLIVAERAGTEELPLLPHQGALTAVATGANLLLAIILFRSARPRA